MNKSLFSVKTVVAIAVGSALYTVLTFVNIPIANNADLRIAVAFLAIFSVAFGPLVGFFTGAIGHILGDLVHGYGFWIGWVLYEAIAGFFFGLIAMRKDVDINRGMFPIVAQILFILYGIVGILLGLSVASTIDVLVYGEPFQKIAIQASIIALANGIIFIALGYTLTLLWTKRKTKTQNLQQNHPS